MNISEMLQKCGLENIRFQILQESISKITTKKKLKQQEISFYTTALTPTVLTNAVTASPAPVAQSKRIPLYILRRGITCLASQPHTLDMLEINDEFMFMCDFDYKDINDHHIYVVSNIHHYKGGILKSTISFKSKHALIHNQNIRYIAFSFVDNLSDEIWRVGEPTDIKENPDSIPFTRSFRLRITEKHYTQS